MDDEVNPGSKSNNVSAVDHVKEVEEMFEQDVQIGHMRKLSNLEAEREFGGSYTTAAIAALQEDEDSFRIIHDGTHK
eukprot:9724972-Karenia_brevis.AAC.1